jgi:hypothetical protein
MHRRRHRAAGRLLLFFAGDASVGDILRTLRHAPGADLDMNIVEMAEFGFAGLEQFCRVMRLDPVSQKPCGHRNGEAAIGTCLRFHPREPARIEIIAKLCLEPLSNSGPALFELASRRICHHHT